jgi:N-acetylmuramoyl-L-alanine amidase
MPDMKQLLIIDPGHGGADPGAVDGRMREKDLVLRLAGLVNQWADRNGMATVLTRTSDKFISLKRRVTIERQAVAAHNGAAAFVSLHINAGPTGAIARGVSVFHSEASTLGKSLSRSIFAMIQEQAPQMPQYNAGVLADEEDGILNDESFLDHSLYVLKHTKSPAALVELGFITSAEDRALLSDGQFLDRAALGIVDGVRAWFIGTEEE